MRILLLCLFIFSSHVFSATAVTTGKGKIKTLMNAYDGWLVSVNAENNNPLNCTKTTFLLEPAHTQYDQLTTYIMAAYTSEKPVIFYLSECDANGYSIIKNIYSDWGND